MRSSGSISSSAIDQRARVEPVAALLVRLVAPAAPAAISRGRAPACAGPGASAPRASSATTSAAAVSRASPTTPRSTGRCAPIASSSRSTWITVAPGAISAPWRVVHGSAPRRTRSRRRPRRAAAAPSGEAKPPEMPTANGSPANSPLATAEVASTAPGRLAEPPQRRAGAGQHRAAAGDDRGPLARGREHGRLGPHGRARRAHRRELRPERRRLGSLALLPPARRAAASARPRGARRPRAGRRASTSATAVAGPCTRSGTAPTDSTSASWSIRKFERSCAAGVSAASRISGVRDLAASVSPVIAFVSPGPWCTLRHAEPPAHPRVAVGHAERAGLVARPRRSGRRRAHDRVRHRQVAAAHQAEDDVAAERAKRAADRLRDEHSEPPSESPVSRKTTSSARTASAYPAEAVIDRVSR